MMFAMHKALITSTKILLLLLPTITLSLPSNYNADCCFVRPPSTKSDLNPHFFSFKRTSISPQHSWAPKSAFYRFHLSAARTTVEKGSNRPERTVVILYHKPGNAITSHSNADAVSSQDSNAKRTTVYEDIETMQGYVGDPSQNNNLENNVNPPVSALSFQEVTGIHSKWHAVGRLDADTTGLLLLTNDGGLVHHATNPTSKSHEDIVGHGSGAITKTYEALIMGHHDDTTSEALHQIRTRGVDIGTKYGGWTKPAVSLEVLDHPTPKSTLVSITIAEGKNRQVRRMFHGVQSGVMHLHRSKFGESLGLGTLKEGQWKILTDEEVISSLHWEPRILQQSSLSSHNLQNRNSKRKPGPRGSSSTSCRRRKNTSSHRKKVTSGSDRQRDSGSSISNRKSSKKKKSFR